mmetsp:Transcript_2969/g.7292  ORF Transcript_2969/g.7292 Transcript_2969/m.7292 type:complete len:225 (-) Transcript_2969:391-1065(-)
MWSAWQLSPLLSALVGRLACWLSRRRGSSCRSIEVPRTLGRGAESRLWKMECVDLALLLGPLAASHPPASLCVLPWPSRVALSRSKKPRAPPLVLPSPSPPLVLPFSLARRWWSLGRRERALRRVRGSLLPMGPLACRLARGWLVCVLPAPVSGAAAPDSASCCLASRIFASTNESGRSSSSLFSAASCVIDSTSDELEGGSWGTYTAGMPPKPRLMLADWDAV